MKDLKLYIESLLDDEDEVALDDRPQIKKFLDVKYKLINN